MNQRSFPHLLPGLLGLLFSAAPLAGAISTAPIAQQVGGAWQVFSEWEARKAGEQFGHAMAGLGDWDGDGIAEIAVGAPHAATPTIADAGMVYIHSGADQRVLAKFAGEASGDQFGWAVANAGDVDGDGYTDLIVGAPGHDPGGLSEAGAAYVYSGRRGNRLYKFEGYQERDRLGWAVAGSDLDHDTNSDLLIGAPAPAQSSFSGKPGSIRMHSGRTGALQWTVTGWRGIGTSIAPLEHDYDLDGTLDLAVGAPLDDPNGLKSAGTALVLSGRDGFPLIQWSGNAAGDRLGSAVASGGRIDADFIPEILVGAEGVDDGALVDAGEVFLFSGRTWNEIRSHRGQENADGLGFSILKLDDLDGDGIADHALSSRESSLTGLAEVGEVEIRSGADGSRLLRLHGSQERGHFGHALADPGDLNFDRRRDLLVGTPEHEYPAGSTGRVNSIGFMPFLVANRSEVSLSAGSTTRFGLIFPASEARITYVLLASLAGRGPSRLRGLEIPLAIDRLTRQILIGRAPRELRQAYGVLDHQARAEARLVLRPGRHGRWTGASLDFAAITYDPLRGPRLSSVAHSLRLLP